MTHLVIVLIYLYSYNTSYSLPQYYHQLVFMYFTGLVMPVGQVLKITHLLSITHNLVDYCAIVNAKLMFQRRQMESPISMYVIWN